MLVGIKTIEILSWLAEFCQVGMCTLRNGWLTSTLICLTIGQILQPVSLNLTFLNDKSWSTTIPNPPY